MSHSAFVFQQKPSQVTFGGPLTHSASPAPNHPNSRSVFASNTGSVFGANNSNFMQNNNSNNNSSSSSVHGFHQTSAPININNNNNSSHRSTSNNKNKKRAQIHVDDDDDLMDFDAPPPHREGTAVVVPDEVANHLFSGDSVLVNKAIMEGITKLSESASSQEKIDPVRTFKSAGVESGIPFIFTGETTENTNGLSSAQVRDAFENTFPGQPFTITWTDGRSESCEGIVICHMFGNRDRAQNLGPLVMLRVEANTGLAAFLEQNGLTNPNKDCSYIPFLLPYGDTKYIKIKLHQVPNAVEKLYGDVSTFGYVGNPRVEFGIADIANKYIDHFQAIHRDIDRARKLSRTAELANAGNSVSDKNKNNNNSNNNNNNKNASMASTAMSFAPSVDVITSQQQQLSRTTDQIKQQVDATNNNISQMQQELRGQIQSQLQNQGSNYNHDMSTLDNNMQAQFAAIQQQQAQMIQQINQQLTDIRASSQRSNNNINNENGGFNNQNNNGPNWGNGNSWVQPNNNTNNTNNSFFGGGSVVRHNSNNNNNNNDDDDDEDDTFIFSEPSTWYHHINNCSSTQFLELIFVEIFGAGIDGVSQLIRTEMAKSRSNVDFVIREDPCFQTLLSFVDLAAHDFNPRDTKWHNFTKLATNALLSIRARCSGVSSKSLIDKFKIQSNADDVGAGLAQR